MMKAKSDISEFTVREVREGRGGKRREEEGRGGKRREEEGRGGKRRKRRVGHKKFIFYLFFL